jgi:hypothetical protein
LKSEFFLKQSEGSQKNYTDMLEAIGALTRLFSDSNNPFLYYRAMENIFCKTFKADNLSRSDISVDAKKDNIGIGLKTFLQENGKTLQKVAEFNKDTNFLKDLNRKELVKKVSELRNERIYTTMKICDVSHMIYHLVTRDSGNMSIYEETMDLIDLKNIKLKDKKGKDNTIHFTDGINDYSYNISKSTLFKRFITTEKELIHQINIELIKDPYDILLNMKNETTNKDIINVLEEGVEDYIVLPLYSVKTNEVMEHSGLNLWNANGRTRKMNEVYIPIPSWIHKVKKNFFTYVGDKNITDSFNVKLPNGKPLNMRVVQDKGKALMSNPNTELGEWILRDILGLREGELVTKGKLDRIGIDSIKLSKLGKNNYKLDFLKTGSFKEFEKEYKHG